MHLTSFAEQDSCCMMKSGPFSDQLELCSQEPIIYNGIHTVISYTKEILQRPMKSKQVRISFPVLSQGQEVLKPQAEAAQKARAELEAEANSLEVVSFVGSG